jgi:hypothetical protein
VVAFIVTVKLVENRVNRNVGMVIVVKVITQYRMPGMIVIRYNVILPNEPSQVLCVSASSVAVAVAKANGEIEVELMLLAKLSRAEETGSERDMV